MPPVFSVRFNDTLVFKAPLLSTLVNNKLLFLRGWKHFDSCIKGFNSLGLMARHVLREQSHIKALPVTERNALKLDFLRSRQDVEGRPVFRDEDLEHVSDTEFLEYARRHADDSVSLETVREILAKSGESLSDTVIKDRKD